MDEMFCSWFNEYRYIQMMVLNNFILSRERQILSIYGKIVEQAFLFY